MAVLALRHNLARLGARKMLHVEKAPPVFTVVSLRFLLLS